MKKIFFGLTTAFVGIAIAQWGADELSDESDRQRRRLMDDNERLREELEAVRASKDEAKT